MDIVKENIASRRTIKPEQTTGEIIPDNTIWEILQSANWAPTHGYTEPWRFTVFSDKAKLSFGKMHAELYKSEISSADYKQVKYDKIINRAAIASHIIALIMKRGSNPKIPKIEEVCAVSCAVQNIQLHAHSLSLAAYWNTGGMTFHPKMSAYFELKEEDELLGFLYLGYPNSPAIPGRRITAIEAKVNWPK